MLAGMAIGGFAVQGLQAQGKAPVYLVTEIDVTNPDAYGKELRQRLKRPSEEQALSLFLSEEPEAQAQNLSPQSMVRRRSVPLYSSGKAWKH